MGDEARREELARFLRSRRARITPESVGLIRGLRRRTPGLRREEVADLAGLGIAWYTWLEQGRDIQVSDDVLHAVSVALRLNGDEREHLFALGRPIRARAPQPVATAAPTDQELLDELATEQRLLDTLDPNPAHIRDEQFNLLAWNTAFAEATHFDEVPPEERNLLWLLFNHPGTRKVLGDWEHTAERAVAQFRFECGRRFHEPEVMELIERLKGGRPEFSEIWEQHEVYSGIGWRTEIVHPMIGQLQFERCTMALGEVASTLRAGVSQHRLSVLVPQPGSETAARVEQLLKAA